MLHKISERPSSIIREKLITYSAKLLLKDKKPDFNDNILR